MGAVEGLGPGWPWWASFLAVSAWPAVYICRTVSRYLLLSKALDKVAPERVPEVAVFINGNEPPHQKGDPREAAPPRCINRRKAR
jgi:hypothetical protein